jgi:hypothetical protein
MRISVQDAQESGGYLDTDGILTSRGHGDVRLGKSAHISRDSDSDSVPAIDIDMQ